MTAEVPASGTRARTVTVLDPGDGAPTSVTSRTTIDTILQSSTVALFHAHGLGVAPLGSSPVGSQPRYHDVVGLIGFDAPTFSGTLTLSIPNLVFDALVEHRDPSDHTTLGDWSQEMANQLLGRIKNRLTMFQVPLRVHLPSVLSGVALERLRKRSQHETIYRFRALRGDIIVTLDAPFDNGMLAYSGTTLVVKEGEIILF
jgi:Chemotaxis phosphatase CheX